ncbi:MAG: GFA family protein [Pseudomonadota bacterium]|nr:GFA family protein [Pseudomonadota bacterium]
MKVDGRCLCGYISYEADVDPDLVSICHCTDCQTLSSSAFRVTVPVVDGLFRFLSGVPKIHVKTAASGNRRALAFCPECGTSIYSKPADGKSDYFGLRVGPLRQRDSLVPRAQYWQRSAQSWIRDIGEMPKFETDE